MTQLPDQIDLRNPPDLQTILLGPDPRWFFSLFVKIPTQHGSRPFIIYPWMNRTIVSGITDREIMLKAREIGSSTFWTAYFLRLTLTHPGANMLIAANTEKNATNLMAYARHMVMGLPDQIRPAIGKNNDTMLEFPGLGNHIYAAPGTADSVRSERAMYILGTEVAFWKDPGEYWPAVYGTRVPGAKIALESTANSAADLFAEMYHDPHNGFRKLFFNRHENPTHDAQWWEETKRDIKDPVKRAREYPETDTEAFTLSGNTMFDQDLVTDGLGESRDPLSRRDLPRGEVRIYKNPRIGRHYILAADVSEGKENSDGRPSDASVCRVVEWRTGEDVAVIDCRIPDDQYAQEIYKLWTMYNRGHIAVERNGPGLAVIRTLQQLGVPTADFYHHTETVRELGAITSPRKHIGWLTTAASKSHALAELNKSLHAGDLDCPDKEFWTQMRSFGRDGKALGQAHDDHVMARAIAEVARAEYKPTRKQDPDDLPLPEPKAWENLWGGSPVARGSNRKTASIW